MYREHSRLIGQSAEKSTRGGLYWRYTLRDYFPKFGQDRSWIPGKGPFKEPESWHGDPLAAIWRGFLTLGNPFCRLPHKERKQLEELCELYRREIPINLPSDVPNGKVPDCPTELPECRKRKRLDLEDGQSDHDSGLDVRTEEDMHRKRISTIQSWIEDCAAVVPDRNTL